MQRLRQLPEARSRRWDERSFVVEGPKLLVDALAGGRGYPSGVPRHSREHRAAAPTRRAVCGFWGPNCSRCSPGFSPGPATRSPRNRSRPSSPCSTGPWPPLTELDDECRDAGRRLCGDAGSRQRRRRAALGRRLGGGSGDLHDRVRWTYTTRSRYGRQPAPCSTCRW